MVKNGPDILDTTNTLHTRCHSFSSVDVSGNASINSTNSPCNINTKQLHVGLTCPETFLVQALTATLVLLFLTIT